jgi:DNA-directed RNA polymerase subunit omega
VDEPEPDPERYLQTAETTEEVVVEDDQPEGVSFGSMSEEELLAGIEGLVPPEKSDDY